MKVHSRGQELFDQDFEKGMDRWSDLSKLDRPVGFKSNVGLYDLVTTLPKEGLQEAELILLEDEEGLELLRHSCAHVLAQAVKELFPETQVTIGPVIADGFYYDFARNVPFKDEDLPVIEKKMKEIIKRKYSMKREEWDIKKALDYFDGINEPYKCEIIRDLVEEQKINSVSVYQQGDFIDLCRGPHIPKLNWINAFKLTKVAGAYWRGDENNVMLTRIYGTAFATKEKLKEYLHQIEEAKKRDHRKLGTELKLFSMHEEAPASPFFHANGAFLLKQLQNFLTSLNEENGYGPVVTPLIMTEELWKASGHYDNYRENMYFSEVEDRRFAVKPMNCPGHCLIYANERHSYKELPIRYYEFGRVHRRERSGVLGGLFRVQSFVQDDAHIFCTEEQVESEILSVLKMIDRFYSAFGYQYLVELSTRPEKRIGDERVWDKAESALKSALEQAGLKYHLNPGDGAFYGPKIDFHLKDSLGRTHQCGTVQLDFSMPERFDLQYVGADNKSHSPVMIHRAIAGSLERFLGILIEHYAGKFPFWLVPQQAIVMNITDGAKLYAENIFDLLNKNGYRVSLDDSRDKLSAKVKRAQNMKIPYMIILGEKEASENSLSLRSLNGQQEHGLSHEQLLDRFANEVNPLS